MIYKVFVILFMSSFFFESHILFCLSNLLILSSFLYRIFAFILCFLSSYKLLYQKYYLLQLLEESLLGLLIMLLCYLINIGNL